MINQKIKILHTAFLYCIRFRVRFINHENLVTISCFKSSVNPTPPIFAFILNVFLYLFISFLPLFLLLLLLSLSLPTYYFFTSCIQVVGEGTSPFCHSCTPLQSLKKKKIMPQVTLGKENREAMYSPDINMLSSCKLILTFLPFCQSSLSC